MPENVKILSPPGAIKPTGPWSLGARGGDFVFVVVFDWIVGHGSVFVCQVGEIEILDQRLQSNPILPPETRSVD